MEATHQLCQASHDVLPTMPWQRVNANLEDPTGGHVLRSKNYAIHPRLKQGNILNIQ